MNLNHLITTNQSIKIVPSIEEHLRTIGLNTDLDGNTILWFEQLKYTWKLLKKSPTNEQQIEAFFRSKQDPHRLALVFAISCDEFKDCKPKTLPYFIIETLDKWSQTENVLPDDSLKLPAFHVGIQRRNPHFLNLILKAYHVNTIKDKILPIVKDMIKKDNCKQASQIVVALEMFNEIPVEQLMFPLVLQDKPNMIDDYLQECPSQVRPFLDFLDKLVDKSFNVREYVQNFIEEYNVCNVKYEKIHHRPLGKLIARLCNKFKIPIETCKNLSRNRTSGGLRYLVHQRYQEHTVSSSVWDDLVKDSLKINSEAGLEFIDMLVDYDRQEALKWAIYLNIPEGQRPLALQNVPQETIAEVDVEENWDDSPQTNEEYYRLSIPFDQVSMIDTAEKFYDLTFSVLSKCNIVSIDCEWKPSFGATQPQVALIQVATTDHVYLIDALLMNTTQYSSFWYNFYKSFLDNAEIIKLGFGIETDLKEIKGSITGLNNIKVKGEGLLDIALLWKCLVGSGLMLPQSGDAAGQSLTSLVQLCFGLPLEKSEQCSNWELRPLRKTQIEYAALDAFVLIEIYNYLQMLSLQQGINFDEICNDVMLDKKKKSYNKKTKPIESVQPVQIKSVSNIKFLVEPQLCNIILYLRYCGIDTIGMPSTMLWHDVINLAISEDRLLLLTKLKCSPHSDYSQQNILDVGKDSIKLQLQKIISNFNIVIRQNDILSRCIYCNGKDIKKIEAGEVQKICDNYKTLNMLNNRNYVRPEYEDDANDEYGNFLNDSDGDDDLYQPVNNVQSNISKTSQGVPVEILNFEKLSISSQSAILCDSCGKLINKESDDSLRSISDLIYNITKLSY